MSSDAKSTLSGGRIERIEQRGDDVVVTVDGERSVTFSAQHDDGECRLETRAGAGTGAAGRRLFEDAEGRTIVRVKQAGEQLSLHLDDGEIFHVLAVENVDGCRVATREEREHRRGPSSFVDRALGRIRRRQ